MVLKCLLVLAFWGNSGANMVKKSLSNLLLGRRNQDPRCAMRNALQ
jgi:hypothetical protein